MLEKPIPYKIWGENLIDDQALRQMDNAMRLPIAVSGALMPDAHVGYGLPIGGVLATENNVIPYAVGVDIACRMRLTIYPISPIVLGQQTGKFENALTENTLFGAGKRWNGSHRAEHAVMDSPTWMETRFLGTLKDTAHGQLGSSGSGNHFVEWGAFKIDESDDDLGLDRGSYLALLSHSGSRGLGYQIAERFSKLAQDQHPNLDAQIKHLAWLSLDSQLGYEYWLSMQLAGDYAAANHEVIHKRISKATGLKPLVEIENHHNFAWKTTIPINNGGDNIDEKEVIIHRKGATPAGKGVLGIIPGSMGDHGYVVRGKGNANALFSASHGAGRKLSRRDAKNTITQNERNKYLQQHQVKLIGGDLDEAPQAYKSIDKVIEAQAELVDIVGTFTPRIVRMDGNIKKRKSKYQNKSKPKNKRNRKHR